MLADYGTAFISSRRRHYLRFIKRQDNAYSVELTDASNLKIADAIICEKRRIRPYYSWPGVGWKTVYTPQRQTEQSFLRAERYTGKKPLSLRGNFTDEEKKVFLITLSEHKTVYFVRRPRCAACADFIWRLLRAGMICFFTALRIKNEGWL